MEMTMIENDVIQVAKIKSIYIYVIINIITLSLKWYIQDCHNYYFFKFYIFADNMMWKKWV